jgi:hypothetical protein
VFYLPYIAGSSYRSEGSGTPRGPPGASLGSERSSTGPDPPPLVLWRPAHKVPPSALARGCGGGSVSLVGDWLEALNRDREASGEITLYRRDMARYNRERAAYRDRHETEASVAAAPTHEDMRELREGYPDRRRRAIEEAIGRLFRERPQFRERRVGQIVCKVI